MLANVITRVFKGKPPPEVKVLSVTASRTEERSLSGVENFLRAVGAPVPFNLEIVGDAAGVSLLVRCREGSYVKQQLDAHYRHAQVDEVSHDDDPLRLGEGEKAWSTTLRLQGPEYLPLRTFDDDQLKEPGSDPLISVIGALSGLEPGERVIARLSLTSLGPEWSQPHQDKLYRKQQAEAVPSAQTAQYQTETRNAMNFLVLAPVGLAALMGYLLVQRGETWKAVLLGLGVAAAMTVRLGGEALSVPAASGQTILEAVRASGGMAPYSCESGVCGACRARLRDGSVHLRARMALNDAEIARGVILTCQALPTTPQVAVDYD